MVVAHALQQVAAGHPTTYADMTTPQAMGRIARYADWAGPSKDLVLPRDASGRTGAPSNLVRDAHAAGLLVHIFTLRRENQFMATNFRVGTDQTLALLHVGAGRYRDRSRSEALFERYLEAEHYLYGAWAALPTLDSTRLLAKAAVRRALRES